MWMLLQKFARQICSVIELAGFVLAILLVGASSAHALQIIEVQMERARLLEFPENSSKVLELLPKGGRFYAQDLPKNGYYKIRTRSFSGWVRADAVNARSSEIRTPSSNRKIQNHAAVSHEHPLFNLKALMGFSFASPQDIVNTTGFSGFGLATGFGGEFRFHLTEDWALGVRGQTFSSGVNGKDVVSGNIYNFALSSFSAELGVGYRVFSNSLFTLRLSGYGGLFFPQLQATATNQATPNITSYSASSSFMARGVAEAQFNMSSQFKLLVEMGYALAKSAQVAPTLKGNGSNLFLNSQGSYAPLSLDVSGIFFNTGVSFYF